MNTVVTTHAEQADTTAPLAADIDTSTAALILNEGHFTRLMAMAEIMATGRATVPKHLQGNKGDCLAVCVQAAQWKMNPFAVAQKTHLVNGTLGYEAQLVIAVINTSGAIVGRIDWEWFGTWEKIVGKFRTVESRTKSDDAGEKKKYIVSDWNPADEQGLGVRVRATLRGETQPRELVLLLTQARTRNSTLWTEDPKQQLAYLAAKRWSRLYTPEVILGVYTPDELETMPPRDMGPANVVMPPVSDTLLAAAESAAAKGVSAYHKFFATTGPDNRKNLAREHQRLKDKAAAVDRDRTIDDAPPAGAAAFTDAPQGVAQAADPATGQVDDAFVAAMNAAEVKDATK